MQVRVVERGIEAPEESTRGRDEAAGTVTADKRSVKRCPGEQPRGELIDDALASPTFFGGARGMWGDVLRPAYSRTPVRRTDRGCVARARRVMRRTRRRLVPPTRGCTALLRRSNLSTGELLDHDDADDPPCEPLHLGLEARNGIGQSHAVVSLVHRGSILREPTAGRQPLGGVRTRVGPVPPPYPHPRGIRSAPRAAVRDSQQRQRGRARDDRRRHPCAR
jgi:hypothetical protein